MKKKLCKKCGVEKFLGEMARAKTCKDGHRYLCKECDSSRLKIWYKKHKKEHAIKSKQYAIIHKEKIIKYQKQWYEENKEYWCAKAKQWREEHKEQQAIYNRLRRTTERGRLLRKLAGHRREQRKKQLATNHDLTAQEWLNIVAFQNNHCVICGEHFPISKLTVDHIHPISRGGLLVKENIQALCGPCNSSKGTKTMEEFLEARKCQL